MLGGSAQQVVAVETAKRAGYYTILCDYLPDNPGRNVADVFYLVSTTDRKGILDVAPNYSYYPIVVDEQVFGASRNEIFDALAEQGIGARKYFYPLIDCFHGQFDVSETPVALRVSKRVLTLPLYADLALKDVDRICEIVLLCAKNR